MVSSNRPTGGFVDKSNVALTSGGGTLVLGSHGNVSVFDLGFFLARPFFFLRVSGTATGIWQVGIPGGVASARNVRTCPAKANASLSRAPRNVNVVSCRVALSYTSRGTSAMRSIIRTRLDSSSFLSCWKNIFTVPLPLYGKGRMVYPTMGSKWLGGTQWQSRIQTPPLPRQTFLANVFGQGRLPLGLDLKFHHLNC